MLNGDQIRINKVRREHPDCIDGASPDADDGENAARTHKDNTVHRGQRNRVPIVDNNSRP